MPSLLEKLPQRIYRAARGRFSKGRLVRSVHSGTTNENGDPASATEQTWKCQGFFEAYDDRFRPPGVPLTDLMVNIFAASLPKGVAPQKDDRVWFKLQGTVTWYQLRGPVRTDPAKALWICQGFVIPTPEDS